MSRPSDKRPVNVLFLCTGNSARSILAEALLNALGAEHGFLAWSAGSSPSGRPHPDALRGLARHGHPTGLWRSKSWSEFGAPDAPEMDIVVTVCDSAANEVCPVWPGRPVGVHWPAPDPAHIPDSGQRERAFRDVYTLMKRRVEDLIALPREALSDRGAVQAIA